MTRRLLSICAGCCCVGCWLLGLLLEGDARAVELPIRKAGLWEMKMATTGSPMPAMTMQHCTDETTDKAMSTALQPVSKEICPSHEAQKPPTGYAIVSGCS